MDNEVDISRASQILGLSDRGIYRLLSKVRSEGVNAVVHGNRGNNHAGKITEEYKQKVRAFATGKYEGFNDRHMQGKLKETTCLKKDDLVSAGTVLSALLCSRQLQKLNNLFRLLVMFDLISSEYYGGILIAKKTRAEYQS